MAVKIGITTVVPASVVRVNELKPGQVGVQIDNDTVWMKVNDRLIFTPRFSSEPWQLAPRNNVRVYVSPVPEGTELVFKSAA